MNFTKMVIALGLGLTLASAAQAKDEGHGTVHFNGSIIDAPCSITPESEDQTIPMGQISNLALKDGGRSEPVKFNIELTQCDTTTLKSVAVTFAGTPSVADADMLAITGSASGASIALVTGNNTPVALGTATEAQTIIDGGNTLEFGAYLQGDGASATIVPGSFTSTVNFTLAYE